MRPAKYQPVWLILCTVISLSITSAGDWQKIIEAESGRTVNLNIKQDDSASNKRYLEMKSEGSVAWTVEVPDSTWYNLTIRYRSPQGEKENSLIVNNTKWRLGFGWAADWNELKRPIVLDDGLNTVELASNWGWIDIDYVALEEARLAPELTPKKNLFYREFPKAIIIKLNAFGRKIESVTCNDLHLPFSLKPYPYAEDSWMIRIDDSALLSLPVGEQKVQFHFNTAEILTFQLMILEKREPAQLTIIAPDISHGNAVLFLLPNGETMLVDCGQAYFRDAVLIPLLEKNGIKQLDYLVLTHYHEDHDSGDKGQTILKKFNVKHFRDYRNFKAGDEIEIGEVHFKVLNAFDDGTDENTRSMAFRLEYNGFAYQHDADIYAINQRKIIEKFPDDIKAHVYLANHHFHGSSDEQYLRMVQPDVVFIQAEQAIYARSTYATTYLQNTVKWLLENKNKVVENLPMLEVGTAVIRVNSADDWSYETYKDSSVPFIPYLPQNLSSSGVRFQSQEALTSLQQRIDHYRSIITDELHLSPKSGDILSATMFLQLENLQRAAENPADNLEDLARTEKELTELISWSRTGRDYFKEKRGRIKIGYLSEIDSTLHPFDLMIPNQFDDNKQYGLLIYLHGKEAPIQKYHNLLWADADPSLDDLGVFKVAIYGRRNCWYQGAGEADVLRVIEEIQKLYPIDDTRIYLMGASMGGFGSWYFGLHYTDRFAAISPICGRTITGNDLYSRTVNPASYIENARYLPVRFYHGEADQVVPVKDSRIMEKKLDSLQYRYIYTEFTGVKHESWINARADRERLPWLAEHKRNVCPDSVIKKCFYLKYGRAYWLEITAKVKWSEFARIEASVPTEDRITVKTRNVKEFRIINTPIKKGDLIINIDGYSFNVTAGTKGISFHLDDENVWRTGVRPVFQLQKRKGLEGPWLDVETGPFILIYGTLAKDEGARLKEMGQRLQDYFAQFDLAPRLIPDTELTDQIIEKYHLHLLGGPEENSCVGKIRNQLPIKISKRKFVLGEKYSRKSSGLRMIYPNPENPDRYLRLDLFPDNFSNLDIFGEAVADYLVYSDNKIEKKGFFNSDWCLEK